MARHHQLYVQFIYIHDIYNTKHITYLLLSVLRHGATPSHLYVILHSFHSLIYPVVYTLTIGISVVPLNNTLSHTNFKQLCAFYYGMYWSCTLSSYILCMHHLIYMAIRVCHIHAHSIYHSLLLKYCPFLCIPYTLHLNIDIDTQTHTQDNMSFHLGHLILHFMVFYWHITGLHRHLHTIYFIDSHIIDHVTHHYLPYKEIIAFLIRQDEVKSRRASLQFST